MGEASPARILRLVVSGVLVVALVATAAASCTRSDARSLVPPVLAGGWQGGVHGNGPWYYEFTLDGRYRTWPVRRPESVNAGTVRVDAATITFSNGGVPVTETWSLSHDVLVLDGSRYLRADGA